MVYEENNILASKMKFMKKITSYAMHEDRIKNLVPSARQEIL
jgi:hypothetical protein